MSTHRIFTIILDVKPLKKKEKKYWMDFKDVLND